ncbi:MAG: DUF721 domain-containing protein [Bdellovibrionales bacterium]|nr:DUF721 domain-containing protein [Bdellovibrionales bacterium]
MINKKREEPVLLSHILNDFFNMHFTKSDQWFGIRLWHSWSKFTTKNIFKQTKPVSYQNERLVLWVDNTVELQELYFYIEELKQTINAYFQKPMVKEIHFTLNKDILKKREQSAKWLKKINIGPHPD